MAHGIRDRIVRLALAVTLTAVALAVSAAGAVAKPAPHAAGSHLLPGGTLPTGWTFPVIVSGLTVATLLVALHARYLRAVLFGCRRRRHIPGSGAAGLSAGGRASSQAARRPAA